MEELVREITTNGLQHKLNNLPRTTHKIYEAALTRIKAQEARKRELAIDLLSYIVHAARPLTVHKLSGFCDTKWIQEAGGHPWRHFG